jgi:hypothetical protein
VLDLIGERAITLMDPPPSDDDWYVNLLWLDHRKCLLITHAGTLFSVFLAGVRKSDLRPVGPFVVDALEHAFARRACRPTFSGSWTLTRFSSRRQQAAAPSAS